jgi:hypothetical protein
MQAAPAPIVPRLPGTSASRTAKGVAIFLGAGTLVVFVPLTLLTGSAIGARGGHLPWPAVQWAVSTPVGALVLIALCILVLGPPLVLFALWQQRREVALSIDVTGVPPWAWPSPRQARLQRAVQHAHRQRWLGLGRRDQAVSLALLVFGTLLAVALVDIFIVSGIVSLRALDSVRCDANGNACPPSFSLTGIPQASLFAVLALAQVARSRWLQHVETTSRVWLRYQDWTWTTPLCYICQPGVTPEAAAAAIGRFSSSAAVPLARRFCVGVLVATPYVAVVSAFSVLSAWLQLAWMPG